MFARAASASLILMASAMMTSVLPAIAASPEAPPGATACSGCHATQTGVQTPVPRLEGRDAAEIVKQMQDFRSDSLPATVMGRIARGFSDEEIAVIAEWYAQRR